MNSIAVPCVLLAITVMFVVSTIMANTRYEILRQLDDGLWHSETDMIAAGRGKLGARTLPFHLKRLEEMGRVESMPSQGGDGKRVYRKR